MIKQKKHNKHRSIKIGDSILKYRLNRNRLSKSLKISVRSDCSVLVSAPLLVSVKRAEKFILEKGDWIIEKIYFFSKNSKIKTDTKEDYRLKKEKTRELINAKIAEYNKIYKFKVNRVFIKNQRTRWGSCSSGSNLNFNYRLIYLPERLVDYVVVHELCHLKEMNHSKRFWSLVSTAVPEYKKARRELRVRGLELF